MLECLRRAQKSIVRRNKQGSWPKDLAEMITKWNEEYRDYLRDESRLVGHADSISFPRTEEEIAAILREMKSKGVCVTTQGARTGIVAGAVPEGGHVLNLSRMNQVGEIGHDKAAGVAHVTSQPGVLLTDLAAVARTEDLFFPPDPTETTASIGGMVAANASGARTFLYGPTRHWVRGLRVMLGDGSLLDLKRGHVFARGRSFSLKTEDGREISGELPRYIMPDVKSAAGYYAADDMDMIDLFIGMEGTLSIIMEADLILIPRPGAVAGLTLFLPSEEAALFFVKAARGEQVEDVPAVRMRPAAIEFFNHDALDVLRAAKAEGGAFAEIPPLRPEYHTAVYVEFHGSDEEAVEEAAVSAMEAAAALGVSDDDTWYATTERELEPLKAFRHAVPEAVNLVIDKRKREWPELTKLGTDMSVPDAALESTMKAYNEGLKAAGLESVIFGHIGNNHVHVNVLPRNMEEYAQGKALYMDWARRVVECGGSVSAEHGIGKIKAPFLKLAYGDSGIAQMRELKRLFDPDMMLNPGNLFEVSE